MSAIIAWLLARPKIIIGSIIVALFVGWTFLAYRHGVKTERMEWVERQRIAEAAARKTERELAELTERGAARLAEKERLLNDQAKRSAVAIRQAVASIPDCRIPASVGRLLDDTSGVSAPAILAGASGAGADGSAFDAVVDLAETLDRVNQNYAICRANVERLTAARAWYNDLKEKVNKE